jgi:hypothetical protein
MNADQSKNKNAAKPTFKEEQRNVRSEKRKSSDQRLSALICGEKI